MNSEKRSDVKEGLIILMWVAIWTFNILVLLGAMIDYGKPLINAIYWLFG